MAFSTLSTEENSNSLPAELKTMTETWNMRGISIDQDASQTHCSHLCSAQDAQLPCLLHQPCLSFEKGDIPIPILLPSDDQHISRNDTEKMTAISHDTRPSRRFTHRQPLDDNLLSSHPLYDSRGSGNTQSPGCTSEREEVEGGLLCLALIYLGQVGDIISSKG
jgi:hypothetical protein